MPAPAPPVQRIDYAPPPPWRKRRAFRRAVQGIVLFGVLGVAIYHGPTVWHRILLLQAQRQCLGYATSPDKVVPEPDPNRAAALLASDPQYVSLEPAGHPVAWTSQSWDRLYALLSPPGRKPAATLFLGERRPPGGPRRLLAVEVVPVFAPGPGRSLGRFHLSLIEPGSIVSPPRLVGGRLSQRIVNFVDLYKMRFFAAQADPEDESHFSFKYEVDGVSGTIDGWLRADDSVFLEVRDGPAL